MTEAESLQDAVDELLAKAWVEEVAVDATVEPKPADYNYYILHVLHETENGGHNFSHKGLYIKTIDPFNYYWHYAGGKFESPLRDLIRNHIETVKSTLGVQYVRIMWTDEYHEVAEIACIKDTTGDQAQRQLVHIYADAGEPLGFDYRVVSITSVE